MLFLKGRFRSQWAAAVPRVREEGAGGGFDRVGAQEEDVTGLRSERGGCKVVVGHGADPRASLEAVLGLPADDIRVRELAKAGGRRSRCEMVVTANPARVAAILAGTLAFALLLPGGASLVGRSGSAPRAVPTVSVVDLPKIQPLLAQADDLAPPPSPDAIVTTPPPAALAENVPPPLPGYTWNPGHWAWDGAQYGWEPGRYIVQPTNGATFTPGYWRQYSGGWVWVDGRWKWGTQGEGE
jgi:hypothetical protein